MRRHSLKSFFALSLLLAVSLSFTAYAAATVEKDPDYFNNPEVVWYHEGFEPDSKEIYSIRYRCFDDLCIRGQAVEFSINLSNYGQNPLEVIEVWISDAIDPGIIVAKGNKSSVSYKYPTDPEITRNNFVSIDYGKTRTFNILGTLPGANDGNYLQFRLNVRSRVPIDVWEDSNKDAEPSVVHYYNTVYKMVVRDCKKNDHCDAAEECIKNDCVELKCAECQYIQNHTCNDYGCCDNAQCSLDELCYDHKCSPLECNSTSFEVNHTCSEHPCKNNSLLIDFMCIDEECPPEYDTIDFTCVRLNCSINESVLEHECVALQCSEDEHALNHTCVSLECKTDQRAEGHRCVDMRCGLFRKAIYHNCAIDTLALIEAALFFIIVFLVFLDYHKYESKYRKKLVFLLMRESKLRNMFKKVAEDEEKKIKENQEKKKAESDNKAAEQKDKKPAAEKKEEKK